MSILEREMLQNMASAVDAMTNEPEDVCGEMQAESQLQDVLFSESVTSVCYWSAVLLLAIAGAGVAYWRLTHPAAAELVNDPFGITTPPWLIVPLPPIGVAASLGHAAWCAVRGHRVWRMLATAAGLIGVMGLTTLLGIR
jgi:hypothetical protein